MRIWSNHRSFRITGAGFDPTVIYMQTRRNVDLITHIMRDVQGAIEPMESDRGASSSDSTDHLRPLVIGALCR